MPTYQYLREDGSSFEIMQSIKAEALKTCPETGQKVKRIISGGGGVVYKGEGWYVTDYKNKDSKPSSQGDSSNGEAKTTPPADKAAPEKTTDKSDSKT
ncbi:MAG: FmdB family zinc ribbon protein [Balneolales bacterium]